VHCAIICCYYIVYFKLQNFDLSRKILEYKYGICNTPYCRTATPNGDGDNVGGIGGIVGIGRSNLSCHFIIYYPAVSSYYDRSAAYVGHYLSRVIVPQY